MWLVISILWYQICGGVVQQVGTCIGNLGLPCVILNVQVVYVLGILGVLILLFLQNKFGDCWLMRILCVQKILKSKYFPHSNVLDASLGPRPIYIWRSLWGANALVKEGIVWCVGCGSPVKVWGDPWLLDTHSRFVLTDCLGDMKISQWHNCEILWGLGIWSYWLSFLLSVTKN